MKRATIPSDYGDSTLHLIQTDDGDIILSISGIDEMRIATDGGRFHGEKLVMLTHKFSEIIDTLNSKPL